MQDRRTLALLAPAVLVIGSDTRSGVDDSYELPFKFTGTIDKLTFKLGPMQLTDEDQTKMRKAVAVGKD